MASTAVVIDPRYLEHEPGRLHPERPERLLAIQKVLEERPIGKKVIRLEPRLATVEEITLVHDFEYVRKIQDTAGHDAILDPDTRVSPRSWEIACLAVGGMLTAVDWVIAGAGGSGRAPGRAHSSEHGWAEPETGPAPTTRNAFAFVRPPGHHAERARAMGFCIFNNVAIAAEYALRKPGIKNVVVIDYDVHHGNGTQWSFYDRKEVFYISTHRYPFYPGTGARNEEGIGKGKGFTLNCPFSGGQGDEEYLKAFDREIIPVVKDYRPDLVLISAGYDAHRLDPLGGMNVTAEGFSEMTCKILDAARESCGGKAVMVLEGGYSLEGLSSSIESCLEVMGQS